MVPSDWHNPDAVAMIIYYDESDVTGGETHLVPRVDGNDCCYHTGSDSGTDSDTFPLLKTPGGRADIPWINNKGTAEAYLKDKHPDIHSFRETQLYAREVKGKFHRGTCLFYRLDLWHRGTPVNPHCIRRVQNLVYKREGCDWINSWNAGAAKDMYDRRQVRVGSVYIGIKAL